MAVLSNSARRKPLTKIEMRALWMAAQSELHRKRPWQSGALTRAMCKLEEQDSAMRRKEIFDEGARHARAGHGATYVFDGNQLGSLEGLTYRRGYDSVMDTKATRKVRKP